MKKTKKSVLRAGIQGFTLVELLVVIAIIGVLVGLTIPAVQAVRSGARQMTCMNHLRQLATAARSHETTNSYLPYYYSSYGGTRAAWVVPLLPHLGEGGAWQKWEKGNTDYPTLSYLICPDQRSRKKNVAAPLSYAANVGYYGGSLFKADASKVKVLDLGAFVPFMDPDSGGSINGGKGNTRAQTSKMKDGAVYTILFGENIQATNWQNGSKPYNYGICWFSNYSTTSRNFGLDFNSTSSDYDHARPSSYHSQNGANVSFADAGAKYLSKGLSAQIYSQLMAPNDQKAASHSGFSAMTSPLNTQDIDR